MDVRTDARLRTCFTLPAHPLCCLLARPPAHVAYQAACSVRMLAPASILRLPACSPAWLSARSAACSLTSLAACLPDHCSLAALPPPDWSACPAAAHICSPSRLLARPPARLCSPGRLAASARPLPSHLLDRLE
jgi:hypothetical protein